MAWVKLDDGIYDHPKFLAAGPEAAWLWVSALSYASRYLTDGFVSAAQARLLASSRHAKKLADRLVEVGLWEAAEGGYQIHDYHDYQPTAEQVRAAREAARERKRSGRNPGEPPAGFRPDSSRARPRGGASRPTPVPSHSRPGDGAVLETTPKVVCPGDGGLQGGVPSAAADGQAADAAVAPDKPTRGKSSRNGTKAPGGVNLGPLVDAFAAHGLPKPVLSGPEISAAQALLKHYEPALIARCWADILSCGYGDDFARRDLSFSYLAGRNRVGNWQREREAANGHAEMTDVGTARRV
jgi:hypothetical protein